MVSQSRSEGREELSGVGHSVVADTIRIHLGEGEREREGEGEGEGEGEREGKGRTSPLNQHISCYVSCITMITHH